MRRYHPERGVVSPAEFIPHVERTALIRAVTVFVAAEALRTARELGERGHHVGVSVNVPYRAIDDPELAAAIEALLTTSGVAASALTLEIVPTGPGAGGELDRDVLMGLRALGVRIAVDDFGRGSSLAVVRTLPLDQVKIDASFIHGLGRSAGDSAVVHALTAPRPRARPRGRRRGRRDARRLGRLRRPRLRPGSGLLHRRAGNASRTRAVARNGLARGRPARKLRSDQPGEAKRAGKRRTLVP